MRWSICAGSRPITIIGDSWVSQAGVGMTSCRFSKGTKITSWARAPRVRWDLLDAFRAAAEQAGIKSISDFNCGDNEGCCAFHVNQKRGRRVSAAGAFLKPVLKRANLRLETGCLVESLIFDGRRAVGVRWRQGSGRSAVARSARCRG